MDSRRLVVWIAAGILGFQGGTLVLDLLNCSVLSWLYVRRHGLELSAPPAPATAQKQPVGEPLPTAANGGPEAAPAVPPSVPEPQGRTVQVTNTSSTATPPTTSAPTPFDPTGVFCDRPRSRIDAAVSQGLSILAGLALGARAWVAQVANDHAHPAAIKRRRDIVGLPLSTCLGLCLGLA